MGLLDQLRAAVARSRPQTGGRVVALKGGGRVNVVGEAQRQDAPERLCGGRCEEGWSKPVDVWLQREPTNPYDANCVEVNVGEAHVGYLSKDDAAVYKGALRSVEESGAMAMCRGWIVGGWDRGADDQGKFGIWLELAAPGAVLPDE